MLRTHGSPRAGSLVLCTAVVVASAILVGCGGGGGGVVPPASGRTYRVSSAAATVALAVDDTNRFTVVARDSVTLPAGAWAQGSLGPDGSFFTQTEDGQIQFSGTAAGSGSSAQVTVRRAAATLLSSSATLLAPGAVSTSSIQGTFYGSEGSSHAALTIDPTGHGALRLASGVASSYEAFTIDGSGNIGALAGDTAARISGSGTAYSLSVSRLSGTPVSLTIPLTRAQQAKWTFLVFINAANNLQEFGPLNMNQMEKVGSSADVNIVVQWKQANCATCGHPAWASTRRYYVTKDTDVSSVTSPVVQDMGSGIDMGDWRELRSFVTWTQQRYPADRYALVVWDHGAGWRNTRASGKATPQPRSVSIDDSTNSEIQTWQLPQALAVTPRMDLVVFDASLMQMVEVAYEIRDVSPLMVGSEESPPGEGYIYDTFLADLAAAPSMTPVQLGTAIVNRTLDAYGSGGDNTQSLVDLTKMQALASALTSFAISLQAHSGDSAAALTAARQNAEYYKYYENKDLWHYAELVRTGVTASDLRNAAVGVQQATSAAVLAERHGGLHANSHGLAIYIPARSAYLSTYANLSLARSTDWDTWLQNQP